MNGERHDVLFDGNHPLPSNYRAYRHWFKLGWSSCFDRVRAAAFSRSA